MAKADSYADELIFPTAAQIEIGKSSMYRMNHSHGS
jgi:hypothetical protein